MAQLFVDIAVAILRAHLYYFFIARAGSGEKAPSVAPRYPDKAAH